MSFEQLQNAIFKEAKEQIAAIKHQHSKQLLSEEERIKNKAREIEESIIRHAEHDSDQEARRLHQVTQLKARADILQAKQEELDKTRQQVVKQLLKKEGEEQERMVAKLFELIPDNKGSVTPGMLHAEAVSREAAKRGFKVTKRTIAEDGGFVFHGRQSDVNLTIRTLVDRIFDAHRAEVATVLFE